MNNKNGSKLIKIGLIYQKYGEVWEYIVCTENVQTHLLDRREMLGYIRNIFLHDKNSTIQLFVAPPCKLTRSELNYASADMLKYYYEWDMTADETKIREGLRGRSSSAPENIIPADAEKLPFSTESYDFYFHKKKGKVTIYIKIVEYHPGILAVPLDKLEEMIKYLKKDV